MSSQESQVEEQNTAKEPTPGEMLRAAREKAGFNQQQMADKIFLKLKNIQDIENDHLDDAMSATFAKGYVRMYAKQLGVDEARILEAFNRIHTTTKPPAKLQSFSKRVAKQAHDDRWMMVTWIILALLLAAFVAWWFQQSDSNIALSFDSADKLENTIVMPKRENTSTAENADAAVTSVVENEETDTPSTAVSNVLPSDDEADASEASQSASVPETPQADTADQLAVEGSAASQDVAAVTQGEENGDVIDLVFSFDEDCWINIEDATGEAIAYGVKAAGRVMSVSGIAPFKVTLGAPEGVNITFDGEAVDISAFQNGRIARFSLPMQD